MLDQATRLREIASSHMDRHSTVGPRVVTITSGKGGVGKSSVAVNLAIALSEIGNNVLLFDADANLANVDVMFGITPKYRLGDVLRGEVALKDILVSAMPRLTIVPGSSGEANNVFMTIDHQVRILRELRSLGTAFDFLLIDTAAGLSSEIVEYAVRADETIVLTNPEPTAVMDAYALIKMVTLTDSSVPINLLVNNAFGAVEADEAARKLQLAVNHFLRRDVGYLGFIPNDKNVSKGIIMQNPLLKSYPTSDASLAIRVVAAKMSGAMVAENLEKEVCHE